MTPQPEEAAGESQGLGGGIRWHPRRGLGHGERGRPHLAYTPSPAIAEHAPSAQPFEEGEPLVTDGADELSRIPLAVALIVSSPISPSTVTPTSCCSIFAARLTPELIA